MTISNPNEVINRKNSLNAHDGAGTISNLIADDAPRLFDIQLAEYRCKHKSNYTHQVTNQITGKEYRDKNVGTYRKPQPLMNKIINVPTNMLRKRSDKYSIYSNQKSTMKQPMDLGTKHRQIDESHFFSGMSHRIRGDT